MDRYRRTVVLPLFLLGASLAASAGWAATPVFGSVAGKVGAVGAARFSVTSDSGTSTILTTASTRYTKTSPARQSEIRVGVCVSGAGAKATSGKTIATFLTVSAASKGSCSPPGRPQGQRPPNGTPPQGQQPPRNPAPGGAVFASGKVTAVKGDAVTVKGARGTVTLTVATSTRISRTSSVARTSLAAGLCAVVRGTTTDNGKTVRAQDVAISAPTAGTCVRPTFGGRRP